MASLIDDVRRALATKPGTYGDLRARLFMDSETQDRKLRGVVDTLSRSGEIQMLPRHGVLYMSDSHERCPRCEGAGLVQGKRG